MKPFINLDELEMHSHGQGHFGGSYGVISDKIGARKLGYNLSVCAPGKRVAPFHNHHVNEEVFLILEGQGVLRFGGSEYPIRKGDVIACPPGGRDVAHQIVNTGSVDLKFFALSTKEGYDIVEYPDSDKVGVSVGDYGNQKLRKFFLADQSVDFNEREAGAQA